MSREQLRGQYELQLLNGLVQELPLRDHRRLIRKAEKTTAYHGVCQGHLSAAWKRQGPLEKGAEDLQMVKILREVLADRVLVDLGGGSKGFFLSILNGADIRPIGYVSVDRYSEPEETQVGSVHELPVFGVPGGIMVRSDALDLVSRVPDGSLEAVSINSLSNEVIIEEYLEVLAGEILRTLAIGGVFIGRDTHVIKFLLDSRKMEIAHEYDPLQKSMPGRRKSLDEPKHAIHFIVLRKIKV